MVDAAALKARYPKSTITDHAGSIEFPVTVVEVWEKVAGTSLEFGPSYTRVGSNSMIECFMSRSGVGIHIDVPPGTLAALFPEQDD